jgi:ABC-2 type transport system ATP-binding protein
LVEQRDKGKTVFLNSHLLSEIEMVCDQITILNRGQVARTATPQEFTRGTGEFVVRVARVDARAQAATERVLGSVAWSDGVLRFKPKDYAQLNALMDELRSAAVEIQSVEPVRLSLEEFFLQVVSAKES